MNLEPIIWTLGGKEYKVEPFTQKIQDSFERYLEHHALSLIREWAPPKLTQDEYKMMLADHMMACKRRSYRLGGLHCREMLKETNHFCELVWYCLSAHQKITKDEVIKMFVAEPNNFEDMLLHLTQSKKNSDVIPTN